MKPVRRNEEQIRDTSALLPDISVTTKEQAEAVLGQETLPARLYLPPGLVLAGDSSIGTGARGICDRAAGHGIELYLDLPYLLRQEEGFPGMRDMKTVTGDIVSAGFSGVLARCAEQFAYLTEHRFDGVIVCDGALYVWNSMSVRFLEEAAGNAYGDKTYSLEYTLPAELSLRDNGLTVTGSGEDTVFHMTVYGRAAMMVSASCVLLTEGRCSGKRGQAHYEMSVISDRTGRKMPVYCDCRNCLNVIRNAHPLSLHAYLDEIKRKLPYVRTRLEFTTETGKETEEIIRFFEACLREEGTMTTPPYVEYTAGRFKKSVE